MKTRILTAIALSIALAHAANAQEPVENRERTFPLDHIPPGARARALAQTQQAQATVAANWYNIGPAAINNSIYANHAQASGRVAALAVDPSNSSHWLIGAAQGGIWETSNAGGTWHPRTDDQASLAMGAIAFAPSSPSLVYAGTGEPNFRGDDYAGEGLLVSHDGGTHWQMLNSSFAQTSFSAIRVNATDPSHLTVAAVRGGAGVTDASSGSNVPPTAPPRGVFISSDSGTTFTRVLTGEATDLQANPSNFSQQYAALGEIYGDSANGVYRTLDGWTSSQPINGPWTALVTPTQMGRIVMAISPSDPNTLYVGIAQKRTDYDADLVGIWRTSNAWDAAPVWSQLSFPTTPPQRLWYMFALLVDPSNAAILYLAEFSIQRYASSSWTLVTNPDVVHPDYHAMAWVPGGTDTVSMLVGNDGGVWLSTPSVSGSWQDLNAGLATSQIYKGAVDPTGVSHFALVGIQDNGSAIYTGNRVWSWVQDGDGADCAMSSVDPTKDWAVSYEPLGSINIYRTLDGAGGASAVDPRMHFNQTPIPVNADFLPYYTQFFIHFEKSPRNDDLFIAGTSRLWRCNDYFSATTPAWFQNSPIMYYAGTPVPISAMAFAPSDSSGLIYAFGTEDGQLRVTTNGGVSWNDLDPANAVPDRYISGLAFNPSDPNILYVTLSGFDEGTPDQPGHLFKTSNALAATPAWSDVSPPVDLPNNCLLVQTNFNSPDTLYVGSDIGVWISYDGGVSWGHFGPSFGMPNVAVFDLRMTALGQVTAFTHGRGAFILTYDFKPNIVYGKDECLRCPGPPCLSCPFDFWANPGDPAELNLPLQNIAPIDTANLTATMLPSTQVTPLNGPQTYGALVGQGLAVSRTFVFTTSVSNAPSAAALAATSASCGDAVQIVFQLQDGTNDLGQITVPFRLGFPNYPLVEDFEQVQASALPPGWGSSTSNSALPWTTTANPPPNTLASGGEDVSSTAESTNHSAFAPATSIGQSYLTSAILTVATAQAQLYFQQAFSMSNTVDGGILEIALGNGPFQEIVQAGGSFAQDGYNTVLTNSNPLGQRLAWSGDSGGWLPVYVNLPSGAAGQQVRLRWHLAMSHGITNGFWSLDTILLTEPLCLPALDNPPGPGCALSFDGVDDVMRIGAAPLPVPWTAEFWVKRQDAFDNSAILLGDASTALKLEQFSNTRHVGFTQFGVADYSFNYIAPTGTWVHLAFVATTNTQLYVNGALQDTQPATIALALGQLGSDITNRYSNHLRGTIDEVRIWNVARSQAQIQTNMSHSLARTEPGLIAYWPLNECGGTIVYDATGHPANNGTLVNGPQWVSSTIPFEPTVLTMPATLLGTNTAVLAATINPNSLPTTAWFQWGADTSYGTNTSPMNLGSGSAAIVTNTTLTGLSAGLTYHYRASASNTGGTNYGSDLTFTVVPFVANFTGSPTTGTEPLAVTFTDTSSGNITNRFWDFGDGSTTNTTTNSVVHTYAAGTYSVTLTVTGPDGVRTSTQSNYIAVQTAFQSWQTHYFGSTTNPNAAPNADPDYDGFSNLQEYLAGFNPNNSGASPRIISIAKTNNNIKITYLGANGDLTWSPGIASRTNVLEVTTGTANGSYSSNNFASTGQTNILSGGTGLGVVTNMIDAGGPANKPSRYYRVRVLAP